MLRAFAAFVAAASGFVTAAGAAQPQWMVAESRHFVVYSASPPEQIGKLAEDLESYDKLMRMASSVPDDARPTRVRVYEVPDIGDVQKAANMDASSGILAFYNSNILGPYLITPRKTGYEHYDYDREMVLHHEYAHHFMLQYFPAVYPDWYTEGFAELIGSSDMMKDGRIGYGMAAKQRQEILPHWIPLQEALIKGENRDLDPYGQGWAMTHFFTFDKGRAQQLRTFLKALTDGKPMKDAAAFAFGDLSRLNQQARAYVGKGHFEYKPVKVDIARPVIERIRPATPGEADLILEAAAFDDSDLNFIKKPGLRERARRFREKTIASIREKAARHPSDVFAQYFLAEAESLAGNDAAAMTAVDRALALDPNNVRAMSRKSILLAREAARLSGSAREAKGAEARRLALKANKADQDDPLPYLAFYESFRQLGQKPTGNAVVGLREAAAAFPLDLNMRQLLVDELAANGRYVEAIELIQAIANNPHDSPRRDAAREQLGKLKAALEAQRKTAASSTKG